MKASIINICGRFEPIGLGKPCPDAIVRNGKETYEYRYLYSFSGKTYKTLKTAVKALQKKGFEYIPENDINIVVGFD